MTTYTENQFATRLLKDLGLIGAEETPSSADLEWAKETAASEISLLAATGIPLWNGSELSIPQEYLTTLSRRVGLALSPSFGQTDPATAQNAMRAAERSLIVLAAPRGARPTALSADNTLTRRGSFNFTLGT
jgi:hypothetical protein